MAGRDEDRDKTVFGGPLTRGDVTSDSPFDSAGRGGAGRAGSGQIGGAPPPASDRTVIGRPAPGASAYPGSGGFAPQGSGQPFGRPAPQGGGRGTGHEDTWIGAGAPQGYAAPPAQSPAPAYPSYPPPGQGASAPGHYAGIGIGRPTAADNGFFPDYQRDRQPQVQRNVPRIPLQDALRVSEIGAGSSSNPLLAAAASLLILLGRLRTGMVELQVAPLMEHVTREIDRFERTAISAGLDPHEVLVAKYALSGTADDIVQNLPGSDRGSWQQYSMVARFFGKRDSGVGFFQEAEKAMQAPAQRYNLLELMLVCMSLGFEGQFRTMPNGSVELTRIRTAIYETLRRVNPRPDEDISVQWVPVVQDRGRRFGAVSVPIILGVAALAVVALFAGLTTLINRGGAQASEGLVTLHTGAPVLSIQRNPGAVYVAEVPQLERIRTALANEIEAGMVSVEPKGDYIALRVGNLQLFDLGKTQVKEGFEPMAARITQILNQEGGPVLIQGYTDNLPLSGRGQFKDNYQLSQARAKAVEAVLAKTIDDATRITVEGKGEEDPVADNTTEEGRAQNRRVEVMLAREGTYTPKAGAAPAGAAPATATPAAPGAAPSGTPTTAPAQEAGQ
ncbi:type VI secretion system protein TssL, long form [Paracoccus aminophilus]|uniref:Type VI secretion system protein ImpK n=1 Tax=Paracoccus aminophilus JCM 7686 TaxID=1367847 RepID=S5YJ29_PARAH|nr:type VI secretion system protein TssL, long form [Paracoccus aminophilus]AGT11473.1 type VI secretion system protein ImpK [Paracoccus aminophilus JCM 7686]